MINADEIPVVEKTIHDLIGWALTKDINRLLSIVAHDDDFFIFHPDSKSTIHGFTAFKNLAERSWMKGSFKATEYKIKNFCLNFDDCGNVAWFSCLLDDHGLLDGKPIGWDDCRWTGTLEKRNGNWVAVQMHFSFPKDG